MHFDCRPSGRHLAPSGRISTISFRNNAILEAVQKLLTFRPDGGPSGRLPYIQVVGFFLSFPKTPISSQSDTRAESYDKNNETCAEIFPGSLKCVRTVFPFRPDSVTLPSGRLTATAFPK
jgi:hypothetical protein